VSVDFPAYCVHIRAAKVENITTVSYSIKPANPKTKKPSTWLGFLGWRKVSVP